MMSSFINEVNILKYWLRKGLDMTLFGRLRDFIGAILVHDSEEPSSTPQKYAKNVQDGFGLKNCGPVVAMPIIENKYTSMWSKYEQVHKI